MTFSSGIVLVDFHLCWNADGEHQNGGRKNRPTIPVQLWIDMTGVT